MSIRRDPRMVNAIGEPVFIIDHRDEHGRRKQTRTDACTLKDAQRIERSILTEIDKAKALGVSREALSPQTFTAFVDGTYLPWIKAKVKASTYTRYEVIAGHLKGYFGKMTLSSITTLTVDDYFKSTAKEKTVQGRPPGGGELRVRRTQLGAVMEKAIQKQLINTANPVRYADQTDYKPKPKHFITKAEEGKILNAAPEWLKPLVQVGLYSGMREGEICAMKWEHVSEDFIFIPAENTKTNEERHVPINAEIRAALEPLASRRLAEGSPAYVFWNARRKSPYKPNAVYMGFKVVVDRLGIPAVFHGLRVAFITSARDEGKMTDAHLMAITGHRDPKQLQHYTKIKPEHLKGKTEGLRRESATPMQNAAAGK